MMTRRSAMGGKRVAVASLRSPAVRCNDRKVMRCLACNHVANQYGTGHPGHFRITPANENDKHLKKTTILLPTILQQMSPPGMGLTSRDRGSLCPPRATHADTNNSQWLHVVWNSPCREKAWTRFTSCTNTTYTNCEEHRQEKQARPHLPGVPFYLFGIAKLAVCWKQPGRHQWWRKHVEEEKHHTADNSKWVVIPGELLHSRHPGTFEAA